MWYSNAAVNFLAVFSFILIAIAPDNFTFAGKVFKARFNDDVVISDYEFPYITNHTNILDSLNLVKNKPQCHLIDSAFATVAEKDLPRSCECLLKSSNSSETSRNTRNPEIWVRCSRALMPYIYKELNNLNKVEVSKLWIVDAHAVVIPTDMFAQIRPKILTIERSRVAVIRDGAFKSFNETLREMFLRDNLLANLNVNVFKPLYRLEKLDMGRNKISKLSTELLSSMKNLKSLILDSNNLEKIDDGALATLEDLRILDLSKNKLNKITKETFHGLKNLEALYLRGNQLPEIAFDAFAHLRKLRVLDLSNNTLSGLYLRNMMQLEQLYINNNRIATLSNVNLENLPNLKVLSINGNNVVKIRNSDLHPLKGAKRLELLTLDNNGLTTIEEEALKPIAGISTLSLQYNRLSRLSTGFKSSFTPLSNLKRLNLGHNLLVEIQQNDVNTLRTLEELQLNDNQIKRINARAFSKLRLKRLSLAKNQLTGLPRALFNSFDVEMLQLLDLTGNPWECKYTDQWLDKWLSKISDDRISGRSHLTCAATFSQFQHETYKMHMSVPDSLPLKQANFMLVKATKRKTIITIYKSWLFVCVSGGMCGILMMLSVTVCVLSCRKVFAGRFKRTVYDAQQLGTNVDGLLLDNKCSLCDSQDPRGQSLLLLKAGYQFSSESSSQPYENE